MYKKSLTSELATEKKSKVTSIGNGRRKKGSYKLKTKKPYRGQGK